MATSEVESRWVNIAGFESYEVSSHGQIRRTQPFRHYPAGMVLKQKLDAHGYMQVALSRKGRYYYFLVHRLVAMSFLGLPPTDTHQAAHNDGNRLNNSLSNLRWATPKENAADRSRHGNWTLPHGELHHQAVLNDQLVMCMRDRRKSGESAAHIARNYGIAKITAYDAIIGKTWTHLPH